MNAFSLPAVKRARRTLVATPVAMLLAGCITLVAPFDKEGVARITELSSSSLAVYQSLLDTKPDARGAAFTGKVAKSWANVETQARVHLVFEESREKNDGSIVAAKQLLGFWGDAQEQYCKAAKPEPEATKPSAPAASAPATSASAPGQAASAPAVDENNTCAANLKKGDAKAMADDVLTKDRVFLERILRAMVKAEEAKKLASGATK